MRQIAALALAGILMLPVFSSALTTEELRSHIATLLAQLQSLQGQMLSLSASSTIYSTSATSTPSAAATTHFCPGLRRALSLGSRGDDVSQLQRYLVEKGYLQADAQTGYFGALTRAAVRAWQAAEGIASSGDEATTGWGAVGAKSRTAVARACGALSQTPVQRDGDAEMKKECVMPKFVENAMPTTGAPSAGWTLPLMTVDFGEKGFTLTVTGLPPGIALRESTSTTDSVVKRHWTISGVPSVSGDYVVVATARNWCSTVTRTITMNLTGIGSSTPSGTSVYGGTCPVRAAPACAGGTADWLGNDSNGCSLGYRCSYISTQQCPTYAQPTCAANEHVHVGGYYDDGCAAPAICVAN